MSKEDSKGHESDQEFYDACDEPAVQNKLENLNLNDKNEEKVLIESDDDDENNDFESKPFDQDKPFKPLHERLNEEQKNKKIEEDIDPDEQIINDIKNDPFYIDEELLKKEQESLTEEEKKTKLEEAQTNKDSGNNSFKQEKYEEALEFYTKAIRLCPLEYEKERSVFYSNRSVCYLKMKEIDKCIRECSKSIDLDNKFLKPILRRAECYKQTDKLEDALEDYKRLAELEPRNATHKQNCYELEQQIKERNEKLKDEMMGKLKELGNMVLKPFGLSTSNFQFVQDPNTGSYSVNFNK